MLYIKEAKGSVREVGEKLTAAAAANKFGVLVTHDLRQKMADKGVEFHGQCLIFEVCNPMQAKQVLEADPSISTALPCRISVYEEGGKVKVATIKPTALLGLFGRHELDGAALEVETAMIRMIDTACG
ncbi:MAG TPA: DUF302 domain-containing protein [Sedimentisphaerales bacterium]|nr:DUF302 domain-containing protein [Sedimentisphaerales bacterium]